MRKRLVSFFALLLCITYSITFGAISANATYNTLDELPIDPVGDMEQFKEQMPSFDGSLIPTIPEREPVLIEQPDLDPEADTSGPVLFSMNDNDSLRYFTVRAGEMRVGNATVSSNYEVLSNGFSASFSSKNGTNSLVSFYDRPSGSRPYCYASSGTVVDIEAPFSASSDRSLRVSGSGSVGFTTLSGEMTSLIYPDTVSIIVNGVSVSTTYSLNDMGLFAFSGEEISLDNDVESVGYRFTFSDAKSATLDLVNSYTHAYGLLISFNDQAVWEFVETEPEYSGLLSSIIGWLSNLWDAIVSLPGNIANLILDGLSALFLPTEDDLLLLQEKYASLFSERLGFIYQGFECLFGFFSSFYDVLLSSSTYEFIFPGISVPMNGESIVILEETTVSMNNGVMDVLRPVCGTIVGLISVIATLNILFEVTVALISGASYFDFIKRGRDGDAD